MRKSFGGAPAIHSVGSFVLLACLGLGCSDSTLKATGSGGSAAAGQGGSSAAGAPGSGGAPVGGNGGGAGTLGAGGTAGVAAGGAGGVAAGGTGGTSTILCSPCPLLDCVDGYLTTSKDPCACPVCAPPDAGLGKDAQSAKDGSADACLALPCAYPICPAGYTVTTPQCGCPTCVPGDAGTDAVLCPPTCPAVRCMYGTVPDPLCGCPTCAPPDAGPDQGKTDAGKDAPADACIALPCAYPLCAAGYAVVTHDCGCPTCEPVDAGVDGSKLDCTSLDECSCVSANGCSVIAESCYCPYPKCSQDGACVCGGGKFLGCAPIKVSTCAAAKARVAGMCPSLSGATFASLCAQSESACTTKCLNDVTSCSQVSCSFCEGCGCMADAFQTCLAKCQASLAH